MCLRSRNEEGGAPSKPAVLSVVAECCVRRSVVPLAICNDGEDTASKNKIETFFFVVTYQVLDTPGTSRGCKSPFVHLPLEVATVGGDYRWWCVPLVWWAPLVPVPLGFLVAAVGVYRVYR